MTPPSKIILEHLGTKHPIGMIGCRAPEATTHSINQKMWSFDSCDYNIIVFDGIKDNQCTTTTTTTPAQSLKHKNSLIRIHHGSLDDQRTSTLINYTQMKIINDPSWQLQMLLGQVKDKYSKIFLDYAKNCIFDAMFCCTRAKKQSENIFAGCWQKSALIYLANAILALNQETPAPSHTLEKLRSLKKKSVASDKISIISDSIGIERATTSLLNRMYKSTIGFAQHIQKDSTGTTTAIESKYNYFIKNSMLADCYFYLVCTNHTSFVSLKNSIHRQPQLIHILKIAFDLQSDTQSLQQNVEMIQRECKNILANNIS